MRLSVKNRVFAATLGLLTLAGSASNAAGPLVENMETARPLDNRIVKTVSIVMDRQHLSKHRLDDEMSKRAFKRLLDTLDPQKIYFLQSDVDEFSSAETKLDDYALDGDMNIAIRMFKVFIERVDERIEMAHKYIDEEHDFSVSERMPVDPDVLTYPGSTAEANDRMRRLIKYRMLLLESDKIQSEKDGDDEEDDAAKNILRADPNEDPRVRLHRIYRTTKKRWHQTDADELLEMYVSAITTSFDPHTSFMSPGTFENFRIMMSLELDGIGAQLTSEDGYTKLTSIVPGGAADKDGRLKPGDKITRVGQGEDGEMQDVVDMKLDAVVQQIRGTAGTVVRLGVLPASGGESKIYNITRAKISLDDSAARGEVVEFGKRADGRPLKIGYIDLPSFYSDMVGAQDGKKEFRSTTRDVNRLLTDFKKTGIDGVVLDLTRNGGGSLQEAIKLTGLFIDRGPVVQVKTPGDAVEVHRDPASGVAWAGPLVVMTSKSSASASEILAGAIQDYRRGLIVGDPSTHGKGTVQTLIDLGRQLIGTPGEMGALKLTIQQFYLPNGKSTQRQGVMSDIVLPAITASIDNGESDLPHALPNDEIEPASHYDYKYVSDGLLAKLRSNSQERIESSESFKKLFRRIELFEQQKEEDYVSLDRDEFLRRRAELDAQREETEAILDSQLPKKQVFRMDYYNEEVLNIAKDYIDEFSRLDLAQAG